MNRQHHLRTRILTMDADGYTITEISRLLQTDTRLVLDILNHRHDPPPDTTETPSQQPTLI